jgi:hypothetical protein
MTSKCTLIVADVKYGRASKTTTKNRHTQETKGTNEHDKMEPKKGNSNLLENKY